MRRMRRRSSWDPNNSSACSIYIPGFPALYDGCPANIGSSAFVRRSKKENVVLQKRCQGATQGCTDVPRLTRLETIRGWLALLSELPWNRYRETGFVHFPYSVRRCAPTLGKLERFEAPDMRVKTIKDLQGIDLCITVGFVCCLCRQSWIADGI